MRPSKKQYRTAKSNNMRQVKCNIKPTKCNNTQLVKINNMKLVKSNNIKLFVSTTTYHQMSRKTKNILLLSLFYNVINMIISSNRNK